MTIGLHLVAACLAVAQTPGDTIRHVVLIQGNRAGSQVSVRESPEVQRI